ncbi:MAG: hypothetical protein ABJC79_06995 [Acidimicrobiia bacterium]
MQRVAPFAAAHYGAFPLHEAHRSGITDRVIHRALVVGEIETMFETTYRFAGAPVTWRTKLIAAVWAGGARAVASHESAARLHGLPVRADDDLVVITCPRWRRARHPGLTVHETKAMESIDVTQVGGIRVTSVARTLLDMAAIVRIGALERLLENALRREIVTLVELDQLLRRLSRPGRGGLRSLRMLVQARLANPSFRPTESEAETMLLQAIRRGGLPEPARQFPVYHGRAFIGRPDLSYPDARICIEYDSDEFHTGYVATASDSARRHRMIRAGWLPITAVKSDLRAGGSLFCAALDAALRDRTHSLWRHTATHTRVV